MNKALPILLSLGLASFSNAAPVRPGFPPVIRNTPDLSPAKLGSVSARMNVKRIVMVLGNPQLDVCSGIHCSGWFFSDGRMLTVGWTEYSRRPQRFSVEKCPKLPCERKNPWDTPPRGR